MIAIQIVLKKLYYNRFFWYRIQILKIFPFWFTGTVDGKWQLKNLSKHYNVCSVSQLRYVNKKEKKHYLNYLGFLNVIINLKSLINIKLINDKTVLLKK